MEQPVTRPEVLDIAQYEKSRAGFREKVLELKSKRQIHVGEHFYFIFENHTTVLYQIQEMMRVERIVDEEAIEHEISTYNELIPKNGGLAATLLLEYETQEEREIVLPQLMGIENHVWIAVGDLPMAPAKFDTAQIGDTRVSSVQYISFPLDQSHRDQWIDAAKAETLRMVVDHPAYTAEAGIPVDMAEALAQDFA